MDWSTSMAVSPIGFLTALLLVTVWHEAGHLLVARLVGIPVKLVALGLGPAVWRRSGDDGVDLVLRALPTGMSIGVPGRRDADGQLRRPIHHDILMAAGGPVASFVLSLGLVGLAVLLGPAAALYPWLVATAALSTLLALLNLLPLPGLDGGHLLVLGIAALGFQLSPQQEVALHRYGLRLLALVVAVIAVLRMAGIF